MGHVMLPHHVKEINLSPLIVMSYSPSLKKQIPSPPKQMNLSPKLLFSQPSLLHKGLGNDNGPIVYITTFNNMLKNEEDTHFFPCLHHI
jgi:hypothetical protein